MIEYLYVHVPFCNRICFYCDFFKVKKSKEEMVDTYLSFLAQEIATLPTSMRLKTIYIGGGTPSCLSLEHLERLLALLAPLTTQIVEYTIELNPESTTSEKLELLHSYGVNRLSIGVQTFNEHLLKIINRDHDVAQVVSLVNCARQIGFKNISLDLIYNLYEQTSADIVRDLTFIAQLAPEHISWYSLILKENSLWGKTKLQLPEHDEDFGQQVLDGLASLGYTRYETSNFVRDTNYESVHNKSYWQNATFYGIGPGASGYCNNGTQGSYLTVNSKNWQHWTQEQTVLSTEDYYFQILMMGLRLRSGIDLRTTPDGWNAMLHYWPKIEQLIKRGQLEITDWHLRCTTLAFDLLNDILVEIL